MPIDKLNMHYSFTNPASIHDEEALTALELAGRTAAKTNEVVGDQNALREETENHLDQQDQNISEIRNTVVPREIDAGIKNYIEHGFFDTAISEYAGDLENRLDNLIGSTSTGSTALDTEVIDLRVGADGVSYTNAGESVRTQLTKARRAMTLQTFTKTGSKYNMWLSPAELNNTYRAGDVICIKAVKAPLKGTLAVYGYYTSNPSDGYDTLFQTVDNDLMFYTLTRDYHHLRVRDSGASNEATEHTTEFVLGVNSGLNQFSEKVEHRINWEITSAGWKTARALDHSFVEGTTLTVRIVEFDNTAKADVYGLYGDYAGQGYDHLGSLTPDTPRKIFTFSRGYKKIQISAAATNTENPANLVFDFITGAPAQAVDICEERLNEYDAALTASLFNNVYEKYNTGAWVSWATPAVLDNTFKTGNSVYVELLELSNIDKVTVYGMHGATTADGYDTLGTISATNTLRGFKLECDYCKIQLSTEKLADGVTGGYKFRIVSGSDAYMFAEAEHRINTLTTAINAGNSHLAAIFDRVAYIGDSLTSGYIDLPDRDVSSRNEKFAIPYFMQKITGSRWDNCGVGGANVITWMSNDSGLPKLKTQGLAQAYIISLGVNDSSVDTDRSLALGSIADVGTEAETYYAGLSKLIAEVNTINPTAKIFVTTMPTTAANRLPYNQAVRDVVNQLKDTYPVHLLDLYNYLNLYEIDSAVNDAVGGHWTAIGYNVFASNLNIILSQYISENVKKFADVYAIPYDE